MPRQQYERLEVWVPPSLFASFQQLVGPRKMSPTIRRMIEDYMRAERIRRRVEGER